MNNLVAKHCRKFNKAKVETSKKDYKRTLKHRNKHENI